MIRELIEQSSEAKAFVESGEDAKAADIISAIKTPIRAPVSVQDVKLAIIESGSYLALSKAASDSEVAFSFLSCLADLQFIDIDRKLFQDLLTGLVDQGVFSPGLATKINNLADKEVPVRITTAEEVSREYSEERQQKNKEQFTAESRRRYELAIVQKDLAKTDREIKDAETEVASAKKQLQSWGVMIDG